MHSHVWIANVMHMRELTICMHVWVYACMYLNVNRVTRIALHLRTLRKVEKLDLRTIKKTKLEFVFHFFVDSFKNIVFGWRLSSSSSSSFSFSFSMSLSASSLLFHFVSFATAVDSFRRRFWFIGRSVSRVPRKETRTLTWRFRVLDWRHEWTHSCQNDIHTYTHTYICTYACRYIQTYSLTYVYIGCGCSSSCFCCCYVCLYNCWPHVVDALLLMLFGLMVLHANCMKFAAPIYIHIYSQGQKYGNLI